jgi:hypothetical protein
MAALRSATGRMARAAQEFLASLDESVASRARGPFDAPDRREWTYLPGARPGLALADMSSAQRSLAMTLLDTGLSAAGSRTAREVMELEAVLRDVEREAGRPGWQRRDPGAYWFRVLGEPSGPVWAWTASGHHLCVHLTVVDGRCAATPHFFGANPAVVGAGHRSGLQALAGEESLARALLATLDAGQRSVAVVSAEAPADIRTRHDPVADPSVVPRGLRHGDMEPAQQRLLQALVRRYLGRVTEAVGQAAWDRLEDEGLDVLAFAWQGSLEPGRGHYYAVRAPSLLIEYDNTQDGANHAHSVWRDLRSDWGADLLAEHHARHH